MCLFMSACFELVCVSLHPVDCHTLKAVGGASHHDMQAVRDQLLKSRVAAAAETRVSTWHK